MRTYTTEQTGFTNDVDTVGNPIKKLPLQCSVCKLDTVGNHEFGCPCNPGNPRITIYYSAFGFWDNPVDDVWNDQ